MGLGGVRANLLSAGSCQEGSKCKTG